MKSRLLLTSLAAIGLFIIDGQTANAVETTWTAGGANANWSNLNNWSAAAVPGANDYVTIPACGANRAVGICPVTDVTPIVITGLKIEKDGALTTGAALFTVTGASSLLIEGAGRLTINAADVVVLSGGGEYEVEGRIELTAAGATLTISTHDAMVGGVGKIIGSNAGAVIDITTGETLTLTSKARIEGILMIQSAEGTPAAFTFVNDGFVDVNTAGILLLDELGTYEGIGTYRISVAGATLEFDALITDASRLGTDFVVEGGGTLDVDKTVGTSGKLHFENGYIEVAADQRFYAGD